MRMHLVAAAAAFAFVLPAGAQTMKPGLWEIHNKMSGGQMDQAMADMQKQLAQMPPEQRKQMEAAMAQQGVRMAPATGGGMAVQMCMTKEMVERNDVPVQNGCTATQNRKSGNRVQFAYTCANPPSSGEGEMTFTPESYTSHMTMKSTVQGKSETIVSDSTGKWLKADCGNVRPMQPRK